jgi:hypothetical protein
MVWAVVGGLFNFWSEIEQTYFKNWGSDRSSCAIYLGSISGGGMASAKNKARQP